MLTRRMIWILAWFGAVVASVGIGLIPGDYTGESFCGVWGCFPPVQALASLHLLWLFVLVPPAVALARRRPGTVARRVGAAVLVFGLLAVACVVTTGLTQWGQSPTDPRYAAHAVRRVGYSLATRTDVPAIQLGLTGLFVVFAARRRPGRNEGNSDAAVAAGALDASGADSSITAPRTLPSTEA
ncbi:unnamed protein product [Gemmataceae bacterium]|nr:unnamed protein product [Gemmataceae bacterium]VTT99569.1 unnamed protein product [Gemmataceae bacterium]